MVPHRIAFILDAGSRHARQNLSYFSELLIFRNVSYPIFIYHLSEMSLWKCFR